MSGETELQTMLLAGGKQLMSAIRAAIPDDTPALLAAFACAALTGEALFQLRQNCEPEDRETTHMVTERIAATVRVVMYKGEL